MFAMVVAILGIVILLVRWRWMPRAPGQTASELVTKAGAVALVLALAFVLVNLTRNDQGAFGEAIIDFLFFFGLTGTTMLLGFAYAAKIQSGRPRDDRR